jgi:hypothetical protein
MGRLMRLSDTRWRYDAGRRVYFVKQLRAPDEDTAEPGLYRVDGGEDHAGCVAAHSLEQVLEAIQQGRTLAPTGGTTAR